jgi:hypothetical protein
LAVFPALVIDVAVSDGVLSAIAAGSLRLTRFVPWRRKELLRFATACSLLTRAQGEYRFVHLLVRDHLAACDRDVLAERTAQYASAAPSTRRWLLKDGAWSDRRFSSGRLVIKAGFEIWTQ